MRLLLLLCLSISAFCQPAFTVASVKPGEQAKPMVMVDPGRLTLNNITLQSLITRAYGVKFYQVSGPDWTANNTYSIAASMPADTPEATVWQMLQTLLTERFQLKIQHTTREMPVYAIVPAKGGPKLKPAEGGELSVHFTGGGLTAKNATLEQLGNLLGKMVDRPIVNQTELPGKYDFTLTFTPDAMLGPGMSKLSAELGASKTESTGPSIFTAFQEQLGLKLDPRKAPIEIFVVESALKVPTEN
jgi:uncharacterized protein (TIGR03435 family)